LGSVQVVSGKATGTGRDCMVVPGACLNCDKPGWACSKMTPGDVVSNVSK
jgi:hypothetical protein